MIELSARYLVIGACAVAAGLLGGCGSGHGAGSSPEAPPASAPAVIPVPTKATGLVRAPRGLTDRLVLRQARVPAGTPIKGTLLVTYRGRKPVNLSRGCQPQYAVAVVNRRFPPLVAFPAVCSTDPFIIKPGENRLAVTVQTSYLSCTPSASQVSRYTPLCLPGRQKMPPLPAGRYQAVLIGDGHLPLPAPAPVPVTLTPAH